MRTARKKVSLDLEALGADRDAYFQSCLKIIPKNAKSVIPLVLKKEQRRLAAAIDLERRNGRAPKIVVLKSRQVGCSTLAEAELFRMCHTRAHRSSLVIAHDSDSSERIFNMSKLFYDELPTSVRPPTRYSTKKLIHFAHNNSRMQVIAAGGRGMTAQYLHISELAFIDDADAMMTALLQTAPDDPDSLIIAESTPNGIGNYFHNLWVNAVAGKNDWVPFFSPWHEDETYRSRPWFTESSLSPHDEKLMADHHLSLEQMAWYVATRENKCNGDQDVMDQEYPSDPLTCFLASGRRVFDDSEALRFYMERSATAVLENTLPPECELDRNPEDKHLPVPRPVKRGRWRIYELPIPRHEYIAGVDIASGDAGGDYTPIVGLDRHSLNVVAVFYGKMPPDLLAHETAKFSWWYNEAKVAGEANNQGILFFDELIDRIGYPNIYYRRVNEESVSNRVSDKPGVWTSGKNRDTLFEFSRRYVRQRAGVCLDPNIIKEWSELYRDEETDRIDHPKGGYSDGTSALNLALYVHMEGADAALQPLLPEMATKALALYHENRARKSMGLAEKDIDIAQLTADELWKLDQMNERRAKARERSGLGGYR